MANGTNDNGTNPEEATDTTNKFISALILNLIIALICLIIFCLLRQKHKIIYAPRQLLVETLAPGKRTESFFSWVIPAFVVKDDEVFQYAGIDALVHMRFLKLCFKIALVLMPYGIIVLIPVNYFGGGDLSGLDRIALSNIAVKSQKVWAHVVAAWVYTLIICYLLYQEWKAFIIYRQRFLSQGMGQQYAVMVRDLPAKLKDQKSLKNHLQEIFPDQVEDVVIVEDLAKWQDLVNERDALKWKLEHANAVHEKTEERPTHRKFCCCGAKLDSITQFETELEAVQTKLDAETEKKHTLLPSSFVVFRSLRASSLATQAKWDPSPLAIDVTPAPSCLVLSGITSLLDFGKGTTKVRTVLVYALVFLLVLFWTVPVAFTSTLIELQNLTKIAPFLKPVLNLNTFVKGAIEGFLSGLALIIFFAILPLIMQLFSKLEGIPSQSEVDRSVLGKLFIFMIVNKFLFLTFAGSALNKMKEMMDNPSQIPSFLAEALPSQAVFFICFIMLATLTGYALQLLRIVPLILVSIKRKWLAKTPREDKLAWKPPAILYDRVFANHLFILMVGLSYSALAPIITPFVAMYFGFGYIVWMHQTLSIYMPAYSNGGMMWPRVFNRMIVATVLFQFLMFGVIGLKQSYAASMLLLPLPVITILFYFVILQHYIRPSANLSLSTAHELEEPASNFIQDVAKCYTRTQGVPPPVPESLTTEENGAPEEINETAASELETSLPMIETTEKNKENV
ncbi:Transmembrane protein 63C [Desmophyllum pertusum]|uniref:Transmembrane protein 63C n=1 Tax=Desmophyllum pertusum TaxID=174260 RepID=A0A9W9YYQ5_9CNID|nr:Transmembrane protein 63C [Desmophyllum pertusum]